MATQLLAGKRGVIFGSDEQSIAWKIAEACHEQGAVFTLTNAPVALRFSGSLMSWASAWVLRLFPPMQPASRTWSSCFSSRKRSWAVN